MSKKKTIGYVVEGITAEVAITPHIFIVYEYSVFTTRYKRVSEQIADGFRNVWIITGLKSKELKREVSLNSVTPIELYAWEHRQPVQK